MSARRQNYASASEPESDPDPESVFESGSDFEPEPEPEPECEEGREETREQEVRSPSGNNEDTADDISTDEMNSKFQELISRHRKQQSINLRFTELIYQDLCVTYFDGKLSNFAKVYKDKLKPPQNPFEAKIAAFARPMVTILNSILESSVPDKRKKLNYKSTFLEFVAYHCQEPIALDKKSPLPEQGLSVPDNPTFMYQFVTSIEDILLYTIRVINENDENVSKELESLWEDADANANANANKKKVCLLCRHIIQIAKLHPCHRKSTGYEFYATTYGTFARAKILNLDTSDPEKLLDGEAPRRLKREVFNLLLFVRLCSIALKPDDLPASIHVHEAVANSHLIQELEALLLVVEDFIP